jgi:hypothetical protein
MLVDNFLFLCFFVQLDWFLAVAGVIARIRTLLTKLMSNGK